MSGIIFWSESGVKDNKRGFERMASGIHSAQEVRRFIRTKGIVLTKELFYTANDFLAGRKRNMKFGDDKADLISGQILYLKLNKPPTHRFWLNLSSVNDMKVDETVYDE